VLVVRVLAVATAVAAVLAGVGIAERAARHVLVASEAVASTRMDSSLRIGSLFFDPDLFGRYLAVVMVGVAAVLAWGRRARDLGAAAVVLAVLWGGLVVTLSRPSFGALLTGLVVLGALRWPRRTALLGGIAVLATGAAVAALLADGAVDRRGDAAGKALRVFGDHVAAGTGSGSQAGAARIEPLAVAAEQGVPGLVLYLAVVGVGFAVLARGARGDPARAALAAAFAAVVVHAWGAGAFLEDPLVWIILALGLGLAPSPGRLSRPSAPGRAAAR
jgi:hypothetical protein